MQGAIVEVQIQADKEEPASWWEAEVKEMREDFIKVCFLAGGDSIVESSRLRPAFSRGVAPSTAQLSKQTVRLTDGVRAAPGRGACVAGGRGGSGRLSGVPTPAGVNRPAQLLAWWVLNEARVVADVMPKSHLLAMTLDRKAKAITLFGSTKAIDVAKMLIDLHAKHQGDIQRRHQEREDLASKLQAKREKEQSGCRLEFPIVKEVIGLIVGKNGKHIIDVQKKSGVDRLEIDPNGPKVVIVGPTQESLQARPDLRPRPARAPGGPGEALPTTPPPTLRHPAPALARSRARCASSSWSACRCSRTRSGF